jgi:hypothetical protein
VWVWDENMGFEREVEEANGDGDDVLSLEGECENG